MEADTADKAITIGWEKIERVIVDSRDTVTIHNPAQPPRLIEYRKPEIPSDFTDEQ